MTIDEDKIICSFGGPVLAASDPEADRRTGKSAWFALPWLHSILYPNTSMTTGMPIVDVKAGDRVTVYVCKRK